jgi:hypothetical protein
MDLQHINSQSLLRLLSLSEKKEELLQILEQIDAEIINVLKGGVFIGTVTSSAPAIVPAAPQLKQAVATPVVEASTPPAVVPVAKKAKSPKKKGGITPEGRAKLAANMKARWAARKAGKPAKNTVKRGRKATKAGKNPF